MFDKSLAILAVAILVAIIMCFTLLAVSLKSILMLVITLFAAIPLTLGVSFIINQIQFN